MNDPFQLVTNCTFKGKDYLVQMCVLNSKKLELTITDKLMAEDWQCEYDASYIEALTHKTGNFKQFDVFVMMLKSGLLKTSDSITLDLLTMEDLEHLRCKKIVSSHSSSRINHQGNLNKRYLILTYSVEFDRIHYPLPLEYCGPPDPVVLQNHIRRLESEVERLKQKNYHISRVDTEEKLEHKNLKEKIRKLNEDNLFLRNENDRLNKLLSKRSRPGKSNQLLQNSLKKLEEQVLYEKNNNHKLIFKLKAENKQLRRQIEELMKCEKNLKMKLKDATRYPQREFKRPMRNYLSPDNSSDRKRSVPVERPKKQLFCRAVASWNNPTTTECNEVKTLKKLPNRFLSSSSSSSSSSESEERNRVHKARSRDKKQQPSSRRDSSDKRSGSCRSSKERNRHSSLDSKKNLQVQRPGILASNKRNSSQEEKSNSLKCSKTAQTQEVRSRESSLSSRGSSKQSRLSRLSNRGSGDYRVLKSKQTPRSILDDREDLKFSMSDLETRIHALQKLLSEGLNF